MSNKWFTTSTELRALAAIAMGAFTALVVVACGGTSSTTAPASASASASLNIGTITGFGSVIVNGVRYDDSAASVAFDDSEDAVGTENKGMQLGMNAEVKGDISSDHVSGKAHEIHIESMVRGPAKSIVAASTGNGGTLEAMGVKIVADDTTTYHNITKVADLKSGDIVNVHGLLNTDGSVQAKFLQKRDTAKYFKTLGTTASTDTTNKKFKIGSLSVTYSDTTKLRNLPNGLSDGLLVRVVGLAADYDATANSLKADKIKRITPFQDHDMNEGEIRGLVADLSADKLSFTVHGVKVTVDAMTTYKNGTAADLTNGALVEVEGKVTNGVMAASKVEFYKPRDLHLDLHGTVTDLAATTTPAGFSFKVHMLPVQTDASTVFTLTSGTALANGMKVEVQGSSVVNGALLATKVTEQSK